MPRLLEGRRLLIVEDDYFAARHMRDMVEEYGGTVLGPVARLDQARDLLAANELDAAILDVKLNDHDSLPLADELVGRGVPIVFATGYSTAIMPERFADTPRIPKPLTRRAFEIGMRGIVSTAPPI